MINMIKSIKHNIVARLLIKVIFGYSMLIFGAYFHILGSNLISILSTTLAIIVMLMGTIDFFQSGYKSDNAEE